MSDRPILFSAPMVRALLAGTKTQTRRVVKFKPWHQIEERDDGTPWPWMQSDDNNAGVWLRCPYGVPGDRLWVRETWAYGVHAIGAVRAYDGPFIYAADGTTQGRLCDRWRPSIHMPRAASRITLEITHVRVERLQDISEANAFSEGTPGDLLHRAQGWAPRAYRLLWEQINGGGSWDANPWVWVVEFKRAQT